MGLAPSAQLLRERKPERARIAQRGEEPTGAALGLLVFIHEMCELPVRDVAGQLEQIFRFRGGMSAVHRNFDLLQNAHRYVRTV